MNNKNFKILGIIPARWQSSRLPGKPLADICGKPMIQHVYERAKLSSSLCGVTVATDDERIFNAVKNFGGEAVMTAASHPNGTSRVCEAAKIYCELHKIKDIKAIINIQGDEPLLNPVMIDEVAGLLHDDSVNFATLCRPFKDFSEADNVNAVKVVMDNRGDALYFSRSVIPYIRNKNNIKIYRHIGIYGYKLDFLNLYVTLPPTPLAEAESLEQLKVLENGYKIRVKITECQDDESCGVDTPEDLEAVRKILNK